MFRALPVLTCLLLLACTPPKLKTQTDPTSPGDDDADEGVVADNGTDKDASPGEEDATEDDADEPDGVDEGTDTSTDDAGADDATDADDTADADDATDSDDADADVDGSDVDEDAGMPPDDDAGVDPCAESTCDTRLTVRIEGDGRGKVSFAGLTCTENPCHKLLPAGTHVVTATPTGLNSAVSSWSGAACTGGSCSVELTENTTLTVRFDLKYNVVFATSPLSFNQLGGSPEHADEMCAAEAADAGLHNTTFRAWVSSDGPSSARGDDIHAAERIAAGRGWVNLEGYPVARTVEELTTHGPFYPILPVYPVTPGGVHSVWTATSSSGELKREPDQSLDCTGWQDTSIEGTFLAGCMGATDREWTECGGQSCSWGSARLYCFGVDAQDDVPLPVTEGRHVFVTATSWDPASGRNGADSLCEQDARAATLMGSFIALLGSSEEHASARFERTGPTWVRMDGLPWLADAAQLGSVDGPLTGASFLANRTKLNQPSAIVVTGGFGRGEWSGCWGAGADGWLEAGFLHYGTFRGWEGIGMGCDSHPLTPVLCLEE